MRGGKKLVVEAYDRNDAHKIAAGTLLTIDNQIDTTTGTAKLKAVFDNADSSLFPNQFVNIRLITEERQNAIVVPTAAIQTGTQGSFVFVVHDGPGKAGAGGGRHKGGAAPAAADEAAPAEGSAKGGKSKGDGGPPAGPPKHANTVNVTVDFTQGSNSILAQGAVNAGDQVIVDGQEKLTDGSNVTPQAAAAGGGKSAQGIGANAVTNTTAPGSNLGTPSPNAPGNGAPAGGGKPQ
jgi:multidrug efflux system membrane fusion protein